MQFERNQTFNLATHSRACSLYFLAQSAPIHISPTILITTTTTQLLWHVLLLVHQTSLLFRLRILWKKKKYHDAERVCRSQCTHSPVQTTSTTVFEQVRMQKCRPTTKKMSLFRWKDLKMALSLTERRQILWRFFHSTTMMLQSVTICNGALPQLIWKRPSTTSTFLPLPSSITLLLPFHVFFRC